MKYIVVLVVALCMSVMPVLGKQVDRTAQPIQGTTVKQVHSESKTVLSDDLDTFHVNSSHTPDHVIGQGGLEMPDSTDKKTTRYSDTDAVNSALQAVVMTGLHSAMHGSTVDAENRRIIALSEKLEALVWCGNLATTRSL